MLPVSGSQCGDGSGCPTAMATQRGAPPLCPPLERLGPLLPSGSETPRPTCLKRTEIGERETDA